ncbi:DNA polymerase subunit Cdc27 [Cladochytrium replicatum]|nr:DNA polymerase subunit Cdc27 [Cladochytrium replicatum]
MPIRLVSDQSRNGAVKGLEMMGQDANDLLDSMVHGEGAVVSYKMLARKMQVDVNAAKGLLEKYLALPPNKKTYATYFIQGSPRYDEEMSESPDQDQNQRVRTATLCQIVGESRLEDIKREYESFTVHIYSVEPAEIHDGNVFAASDFQLCENDTFDTIKSCRIIQNDDINYILRGRHVTSKPENQTVPAPAFGKPSVKSSAAPEVAESAGRSEGLTESSRTASSSKSTTAKSAKQDSKLSAFFSKGGQTPAVSKMAQSKADTPAVPSQFSKQENSSSFSNQQTSSNVPEKKQTTTKSSEPLPLVQPRRTPSASATEKQKGKVEQAKISSELESRLFDEDEVDGESQPQDEEQAVVSMDIDSESVDKQPNETTSEAQNAQPTQSAPPNRRRVRKRRKVSKRVSYMDGKYLKTKTEDAWESYSESEDDVPAAPSPNPAFAPIGSKLTRSESVKSVPDHDSHLDDDEEDGQRSKKKKQASAGAKVGGGGGSRAGRGGKKKDSGGKQQSLLNFFKAP